MKKAVVLLLLIYLGFVFSFPYTAFAEIVSDDSGTTFIAPASLQRVEKEAFADVATRTVVFQEGFRYLGDEVFKGAFQLKNVYIPKTTAYISDSAFSTNIGVSIHSTVGSYAQRWAKKHQVAFVADYTYAFEAERELVITRYYQKAYFMHTIKPQEEIRIAIRADNKDRSMRPQDRPELNPIDYRFP